MVLIGNLAAATAIFLIATLSLVTASFVIQQAAIMTADDREKDRARRHDELVKYITRSEWRNGQLANSVLAATSNSELLDRVKQLEYELQALAASHKRIYDIATKVEYKSSGLDSISERDLENLLAHLLVSSNARDS